LTTPGAVVQPQASTATTTPRSNAIIDFIFVGTAVQRILYSDLANQYTCGLMNTFEVFSVILCRVIRYESVEENIGLRNGKLDLNNTV
jgi:hypothetical protein